MHYAVGLLAPLPQLWQCIRFSFFPPGVWIAPMPNSGSEVEATQRSASHLTCKRKARSACGTWTRNVKQKQERAYCAAKQNCDHKDEAGRSHRATLRAAGNAECSQCGLQCCTDCLHACLHGVRGIAVLVRRYQKIRAVAKALPVFLPWSGLCM